MARLPRVVVVGVRRVAQTIVGAPFIAFFAIEWGQDAADDSPNVSPWPPPMVSSTRNPDPHQSTGNNSFSPHNNMPPSKYQQPYMYAHFTATQRFWWICPCYQNGNLQLFVPDVTIDRQVFQDTDSIWKYQIQKSGYTNKVPLP